VLGLVLLTSGCVGSDSGAASAGPTTPAVTPAAQVELHAVLREVRPDAAAGIMQVLTTDDGGATAQITSMQLQWPGFEPIDPDSMVERFGAGGYPLAPGLSAALPIHYGTAVGCTAGGPPTEPPVALAQVTGQPEPVRLSMSDPGSLDLLHRRWSLACARQHVDAAVSVRFGSRWTDSTVDGTAALRGAIVLRRTGPSGPVVTIDTVGGSVLIQTLPVQATGRPLLTMGRTQQVARLPVDLLTTGRCDGHALSESSTTYVLSANLTVAGGPPVTFLISPPVAVQQPRLIDVIYAGCGR
jgi:hypothetical protein